MRDYATTRAISDQGEGDAKMYSDDAASREVRGIQNRRFLVCENYLDIGREERKQECVQHMQQLSWDREVRSGGERRDVNMKCILEVQQLLTRLRRWNGTYKCILNVQ
jgi:hypothetical protein